MFFGEWHWLSHTSDHPAQSCTPSDTNVICIDIPRYRPEKSVSPEYNEHVLDSWDKDWRVHQNHPTTKQNQHESTLKHPVSRASSGWIPSDPLGVQHPRWRAIASGQGAHSPMESQRCAAEFSDAAAWQMSFTDSPLAVWWKRPEFLAGAFWVVPVWLCSLSWLRVKTPLYHAIPTYKHFYLYVTIFTVVLGLFHFSRNFVGAKGVQE